MVRQETASRALKIQAVYVPGAGPAAAAGVPRRLLRRPGRGGIGLPEPGACRRGRLPQRCATPPIRLRKLLADADAGRARPMKVGCDGPRSHYDRPGKTGDVLHWKLSTSDPGAIVLQAGLLAIIAGYADTIGYLHFNAFAGLMTGNTIFLGIEVATGEFKRAAFHFMIIVAFLVGVIASRALLRHGMEAWQALVVTSLMLVLCSFVSKDFGAVLLALAMGNQNAAANRFNGVALNTVFITGNLQKLGEELVHWVWPHENVRSDGSAIYALVWFSYALGAAVGAAADAFVKLPLLVPALVLPFVMLRPRPALPKRSV
jgi:uncharacterized membrane protein YoaK (UPF0700 family)